MTNTIVVDSGLTEILNAANAQTANGGESVTLAKSMDSVQPYEHLIFAAAAATASVSAAQVGKTTIWDISGPTDEVERLLATYKELRTAVYERSKEAHPTGESRSLLQQARFRYRRDLGRALVEYTARLATGDTDAYAHTNSKGNTYLLHSREQATKGGKTATILYFAKERKETPVATFPAGYTIKELPNGLPILKRIK